MAWCGRLERKALTMAASWKRGFICILPYFELLGRYAWLSAKHAELQGKYMCLKRSRK